MEKEGVLRVYTHPFAQEGARQGNRILFRAVLETFPLVQSTWKGEIKGGKLHLTRFPDEPFNLALSASSQVAYEKALKALKATVANLLCFLSPAQSSGL